MCGICGQFRFDGEKVSSKSLDIMMSKLARRGPDSSGKWLHGVIGFGHQRLSIIDLSNLGSQPMVDEKLGLTLIFNGTIYNYKSLRALLISHGYRFFSNSDTEVIIKAYHYWGEGCLERLDGMFAFAIWDTKKKKLFLARDRLGVKPLFYCNLNNNLLFSSEIKSILQLEERSEEHTSVTQ